MTVDMVADSAVAGPPASVRAGFCPPCAADGHATYTGPGAPPCATHRRDVATRVRSSLGAVRHGVRGTSRRGAGGRTARPPRRVVEHTPRWTGSRRAGSPGRLEIDGRRLVRLAAVARRQHRVMMWLACVLYYLDVYRPAGAGKADARRNVALLAMYQAVSADWASGRRARAGRRLSAALAGLSERTVERHWQLLECARLMRGDGTRGRLLPTRARMAIIADPSERMRTANRKEMTLAFPWWLKTVTDEEIWPYVIAARAMLDEFAGRIRAVDNVMPGQMSLDESVAPSLGFDLLTCAGVIRSKFSQVNRVAVDNRHPRDSRPGGRREEQRRASRSPIKKFFCPIRSETPSWAVDLAREVIRDRRLPCADGAEIPLIAQALRRRVGPIWGIDDVVEEALQRLHQVHQQMVLRPRWRPAYFEWLLELAVPGEPPAQIKAAVAAEYQDRSVIRRVEFALPYFERAATAAPPDSAQRQWALDTADAIVNGTPLPPEPTIQAPPVTGPHDAWGVDDDWPEVAVPGSPRS